MVDIAKYEYSNNELLLLMLKDQNIHEGHWVLTVTFSFGALNFGKSPDGVGALPSGITSVNGIGLERVQEAVPFSVDAARVNPLPTKKPRNLKKKY
ncbi:MAG: hypothetical protein KDE33_12950 [Bacteroidetes bacterium]|nr:hypothetical protein [Bacteroidota bacterium]